MRALSFQRALPLFVRQQVVHLSPRICAIRQFNDSPPSADENSKVQVTPPKKRGRPRKVKIEETTDGVALADEASVGVPPPPKVVKPRKAPKISDISRLIPPTPLDPPPSRPLRPYQEECVEACLTAISEGKRRLGISLATGAGKTVIFTNLIGKVQLEDQKRYQTLILVHRRELVEQAARHCVEAYPDKVCPVERG
jgi:hypothetical protein